jgi:hypothetical protein
MWDVLGAMHRKIEVVTCHSVRGVQTDSTSLSHVAQGSMHSVVIDHEYV